jgi:acryloyl-coenzyme A reductase
VQALGGAHVALELTGEATFRDSLRSLRRRGRLVVLGNIGVGTVSIGLGALILFAHRIAGTRSYTQADLETCFGLVASGQLRPVIDRTLPLSEARAAHELLEARAVSGRIVLVP